MGKALSAAGSMPAWAGAAAKTIAAFDTLVKNDRLQSSLISSAVLSTVQSGLAVAMTRVERTLKVNFFEYAGLVENAWQHDSSVNNWKKAFIALLHVTLVCQENGLYGGLRWGNFDK
jgi:hypothetical protein